MLIDVGAHLSMLLGIHEDVDQCISNRARTGERPRVVAITPDAPAAAEGAVDGAGDANREAADTGGEGAGIAGFGEAMNVIVLNRILHDPKVLARRLGERATDRGEDAR
jgi:hypothetical protein